MKIKRKIASIKRNIKKMETSKKIITYVLILTTIITLFTLWIVARTGDTSPLQVLIPAVFAELATGTAFYYKKAEAENKLKIAKSLDELEKEIKKKVNIGDVFTSNSDDIDNIDPV